MADLPRSGRSRVMEMFRWAYRILGVLINNLYCIPTYVVWCLLLHPVYIWDPDLYWKIEGQFFQWLLTMVAYWSYSAGYHIVETGDSIENLINEETLVLVNHQSTSDVPLLMYAFSTRNGLLQKLNWIMDAVFQYTNFGVVSTLHGDFFINAGRTKRDASLRDLERFLKRRFQPRKRKWLVLFPEGGFLRKRKEASKRYAEKMKLPNLEFVTLPRMGALQTIINTLCTTPQNIKHNVPMDGSSDTLRAGHLKYVIDMTIAYPDGSPLDLGAVITGHVPPCQVRFHYKIYPITEVPYTEPEELQTWLYNRYIEKNNMLGHYYKTGIWNSELCNVDINRFTKGNVSQGENVISNNSAALVDPDVVDKAVTIPSELIDADLLSNSVSPEHKSVVDEVSSPSQKSDASDCIYDPVSDEDDSLSCDRILHLDLLRVFLLHVMFISSTLFHLSFGRAMINLVFGV